MTAVDTNLLVYAHREDAEFHQQALAALLELAESGNRWAIPWPCLHEFLAITTHPRLYRPPSPTATALKALDAWLVSPMCEMIGEESGYLEVLKRLAIDGRIAGPAVHDARVAAICTHHGVQTLWTADRDFSRFGTLKAHNPLAVR
ncbi:MAG: PIN domain-containing protein [Candidatus Latescibacteria bacterium]|jgi:hypothetical protein|nr:PIN domain-containing protein [Candidatus Latescibacterota bacterium]